LTTAQFKGTIYLSTRMFTEQQFGPDAVERVLSQLAPNDRDVLHQVTSLGWYPVGPVLAYHHALDRCFGKGNLDLCVEAGRFSAGWALNTVLKVFVKLRNPHWLTEKSASVWSRYHDTGRWEYDPPRENQLRGRLYDYAVHDEAFCARLRGWLMGAIELTGGRNPKATERCCTPRGLDHHEFFCTWQ
jgi:hypothetical protein